MYCKSLTEFNYFIFYLQQFCVDPCAASAYVHAFCSGGVKEIKVSLCEKKHHLIIN